MLFYHNKSRFFGKVVMLVEIPEPEVILSVVFAFLGGLGVLYLFYKIKSLISIPVGLEPSYLERMEFYEKQLIDMKIRMDSFDIEGWNAPRMIVKREEKQMIDDEFLVQKPIKNPVRPQKEAVNEYSNTVDYVLGLITNKAMTSRDIQLASQRSREHTARLMKKLYQEGLVQRNVETKPYAYSITEKGLAKLGKLEQLQKN
jgi:predicted transcriptional regulator